ncbi:hypothetical protein DFR69_101839 [Nocardia neocaledoniensis]|jgi:hypothetical protein|uniref:DUF3592 domain-containing protein n=2 Tax=Nocardiaceae TaxID=85025 RepID=A0A317P189_9NOCA|nr:hypothetical protein DFR69_101839 [Nocardia neocaledoniensis]
MGTMLEVVMAAAMVTMLLVTLGAVFAHRFGRGGGQAVEQGSLIITGVSPLPAMTGEHYVTITGALVGPSVPERVVYRRFAWDATQWPSIGEHLVVVYPPRNPDRWVAQHPGLRSYLGS